VRSALDEAEVNRGCPPCVPISPVCQLGSFGGFFRGSSEEAAIREDTGSLNGILLPARAPFSTELQQDQGSGKESTCEEKKATRILAASLFDCAEEKRQEKTSQAASGADQSREDAHAFWESLRQELKNGSISHAHHSHGKK
jgi:hypothetical protein